MLEQILHHIHNRFEYGDAFTGRIVVQGGELVGFEWLLQDGQYCWVEGSIFNDGLHQYQHDELTDETFEGSVVPMAVPRALTDLAQRIEDWQESNGDVLDSPYQSESFGGYSYTKASGSSGSDSSLSGWMAQFRKDLDPWRKISHSGW